MLRAVRNGTVIAETPRTVVVEGNHYFPPEALHRQYNVTGITVEGEPEPAP
ncbi:DUF427 domain-containing protein [Streptomyces sp. NPDC050315]|uniref:DUF427 domain-containing protein n=1 Tax=Streptomyces sp. NPDC050315 TaxID=3155039 RepID=UPI003413A31B